jgi:NMD protein affecting ribosome stability and mRNA decay
MMKSPRKDRLIQEREHDVYLARGKWPEPTLCTVCGAVFVDGRWSWADPPISATVHKVTCPACRRIADRYPAGYIEIKGEFFTGHRDEILNLIERVAKQEKERHPLERVISLTPEGDHLLATTSGVHLARRIGQALARAYKGELTFSYADADQNIRVHWQR